MPNKPTPAQISRVMSELGRRNKGKPKKLTPAGIAQRRKAGKASARLRKANAKRKAIEKIVEEVFNERLRQKTGLKGKLVKITIHPSVDLDSHTPANIAPLAQSE